MKVTSLSIVYIEAGYSTFTTMRSALKFRDRFRDFMNTEHPPSNMQRVMGRRSIFHNREVTKHKQSKVQAQIRSADQGKGKVSGVTGTSVDIIPENLFVDNFPVQDIPFSIIPLIWPADWESLLYNYCVTNHY